MLRELFPYFMQEKERAYIANVAAYRLRSDERPDSQEGYLADRWLFPATSSEWTAPERALLKKFSATFRPQWAPPKQGFSAWHYFVLRPDLPTQRRRYERPVVVLQDSACFSATDIFLAACKGRKNITLIGTHSGGGSGRALPFSLPHSGLSGRMSSMASFRADGSLYDGVGIAPDIVVWPAATDFIGPADAQLAAAIAHLQQAR